jgi:hypothetical protein
MQLAVLWALLAGVAARDAAPAGELPAERFIDEALGLGVLRGAQPESVDAARPMDLQPLGVLPLYETPKTAIPTQAPTLAPTPPTSAPSRAPTLAPTPAPPTPFPTPADWAPLRTASPTPAPPAAAPTARPTPHPTPALQTPIPTPAPTPPTGAPTPAPTPVATMREHAIFVPSGGGAGAQCESCGMYLGHSRSSSCAPCPGGKFSTTLTTVACTICPRGQFSVPTLRRNDARFAAPLQWGGACRCARCPPGRFQGEEGRRGCEDCAAGRYAPRHAMGACLPCLHGRFGGAGRRSACTALKPCNAGHEPRHSAGAAMRCTPCAAGRAGADGLGCSDCAPGRFQHVAGAMRCERCPRGRWRRGCSEAFSLLRYTAALRIDARDAGGAPLLLDRRSAQLLEAAIAMSLGLAAPPPTPARAPAAAALGPAAGPAAAEPPATPAGGVRVTAGSAPNSMRAALFVAPALHHTVLRAIARPSFCRAVSDAYQLYATEYRGADVDTGVLHAVAGLRFGKVAAADSPTSALMEQEQQEQQQLREQLPRDGAAGVGGDWGAAITAGAASTLAAVVVLLGWLAKVRRTRTASAGLTDVPFEGFSNPPRSAAGGFDAARGAVLARAHSTPRTRHRRSAVDWADEHDECHDTLLA